MPLLNPRFARLAIAFALIASGCTINSTTNQSAPPPATSGAENKPKPRDDSKRDDEPKPEKPKARPEKPKPEKPKPEKPKPEKPKPEKPKPEKPKPEKPKDEPAVEKPKDEEPAQDKPAPQPERSKIVLPVKVALAAIEKELDALVPQTDKKDWTQITEGNESPKADLKYELWRDPIAVELDEHTFHITVPVRYAATVRAQAKNPLTKDWFWIAKSETWGTKQEPQRLTAHFEATVSVEDDWKVKSKLKLVKLEHGEPPSGDICKTVAIKVCVSKSSIAPKVRDGIDKRLEPKLQKALAKVDQKIEHAFDLHKRAASVWKAIQKPQALPGSKDSAWLVVRPSEVGVGRLTKEGSDVRVNLAIEGKLSVESGKKPKVEAVALPSITKVEGDPGFHVVALLSVPRAVLGEGLPAALKGLDMKGTKLSIKRAEVVAQPDEDHPKRLTVKVAFGDAPEDVLELHGELAFDADKQRLSIDDFAISSESKKVMEAKLPGLDLSGFEKKVAAKARWDLSDQAAPLRKAILGALEASLNGHASLHGELKQLDVKSLEVTASAVEAQVIVGGALEVEVTAR